MIGFAHHDPFSPGAADELRRAVAQDELRGYKVIAPALAGPIDAEALLPVWQAAEDLGIPVLVHVGTLDGGGGTAAHVNISPLTLHAVAKAFPYTARNVAASGICPRHPMFPPVNVPTNQPSTQGRWTTLRTSVARYRDKWTAESPPNVATSVARPSRLATVRSCADQDWAVVTIQANTIASSRQAS